MPNAAKTNLINSLYLLLFMDDIINLTCDLMRFRTTSDNPQQIKECADFIQEHIKHKSIIVSRHERNGKTSIVATFKSTKKPRVFLNAHFDVVPASSHLFEPKIEGERLYGRGSEDCKAQVAVLMALMKNFAGQDKKPDMGIMLTSDEEVHGNDGVKWLLEDMGYGCDFAIVADGGDNFDIVTKHKGVLQIKLTAAGKTAHSARAWEGGENAVEKLINAASGVKKLFPNLTKAEWKTTANINIIKGGETINKIPDYAEMLIDIRRTEKDSEESIMAKLSSIKGIGVEKIATADMLDTDENNKYITELKKSAEKILGRKAKTSAEHGATDARYFSARGMPAVLFKAAGSGAHSDNEHLLISSIKPYYEILADFLKKI